MSAAAPWINDPVVKGDTAPWVSDPVVSAPSSDQPWMADQVISASTPTPGDLRQSDEPAVDRKTADQMLGDLNAEMSAADNQDSLGLLKIIPEGAAALRRGVYSTAAAGVDAVGTHFEPERRATDPARQPELDALWQKIDSYKDQVRSAAIPQPWEREEQALKQQAAQLSSLPAQGFSDAAKELHAEGQDSFSQYGVDPNDKSTGAQIGRAVGGIGGALPYGPLMLPQMLAQVGEDSYRAALADGKTEKEAHEIAGKAVMQELPKLAAYTIGGKFVSAATGAALPSAAPLTRAVAGGAAAAGVNAVVSAGTRAAEGQPIAPTLEQGAADVLWGFIHGSGEHATASEQSRQKAAQEQPAPPPAPVEKGEATTPPVPAQYTEGPVTDAQYGRTLDAYDAFSKVEPRKDAPAFAVGDEIHPGIKVSAVHPDGRVELMRGDGAKDSFTPEEIRNTQEKLKIAEVPAPKESAPPVTEPASDSAATADLWAPAVEHPVRAPESPPVRPDGPVAAPIALDEATTVKNAGTDADRTALALQPAGEPNRRPWEQVDSEARARLERDPGAADRLIEELAARPRQVSDTESAMLAYRWDTAKRTLEAANEAVNHAYDGGSADELDAAKSAREEAEKSAQKTADVLRAVGTKAGQGLAARRMFNVEDWSLAGMMKNYRAKNGGQPLTQEESAFIRLQHEKLKETAAKVEKHEKLRFAMERATAAEETIKQLQAELMLEREAAHMRVSRRVADSLKKQAAAARQRIQRRVMESGGKAFAGPDPTAIADLADYALIGASHIAEGAARFDAWASRMVADLGKTVEAHLPAIFDASKKKLAELAEGSAPTSPRQTVESIKARIAEGGDISRSYVRRLAKSIMASGVEKREDIVTALHAALKEVKPDIGRTETVDLLSGYGDVKLPSNEPISRKLSEYTRELQLIRAIEDMQAGAPPKRSGPQRHPPSDEARRLEKLKEDVKKRGGFVVTDPETQLKTALGAVRTRLKNDLRDLTERIETGRRPPGRTPLEYDNDTQALKDLRDRVKGTLEAVEGKPETSDADRLTAAEKALESSLSEYERRIREEDVRPRSPQDQAWSPKIAALRARRDVVKAEYEELKSLAAEVNGEAEGKRIAATEKQIAELDRRFQEGDLAVKAKPAQPASPELERARAERDAMIRLLQQLRNDAKPKISDDERALKAYKVRVARQISELHDRLARLDFAHKAKPVPPKLDMEGIALRAAHEQQKREYVEGAFKAMLKNRSVPRKVFDTGKEIVNTARAVMTSLDLSAVLRQGGLITFAHPLRAASAFPAMFKALISPRRQAIVEQEIRERPNAQLYKDAKLYLAEDGISLSKMEEAYMSRWAKNIPLVAASERAYVTFLNRLRADSFDAMAASLGRRGTVTLDEARALANFINVATGRGVLGKFEQSGTTLSTIFFAPRYVVSRFELLAGQPLYGGNARTRIAVANEYGRYLAGVGVFVGLGLMAGGQIGPNPADPDFGKLKFGNTRLDPFSGLAQSTVFLSREKEALTRFFTGDQSKPPKYGSGGDVLGRFLRSKLSPTIGAGVDAVSGKDVVGGKVTPGSVAARSVIPLSIGDVATALKDQGVARGTALALLAFFGMGVQTYEPKPKR